MPGWTTLDELLSREFEQAIEEGKPADAVAAIRADFEDSARDEAAMTAAQQRLVALPVRDDFPFDEPNELSAIQALRQSPRRFDVPAIDDRLADQLHGGWLGRCGGCALGKPVELIGLCPPAAVRQKTWRDIKRYLTAIDPAEWPIKDFIPGQSPALGEMLAPLIAPLSTREQINHMESDDDIRYTVLGQLVLAEKGAAFTTEDVADKWFQNLPYRAVCTAETQAYRNLVVRYDTHESTRWSVSKGIDWDWVASYLNPYREWIGAQIRIDSYGYAAPGQPALAAEFAWRDARMSHVKNGIYGAMACAAMIAAAFATRDVKEIVAAGLGEIPATSRVHAEMLAIVDLCERHDNDWDQHEAVFDGICELLGHYSAIHTNNNLGVIIASLLLSGGDYHKGITASVMAGFDTDCNGATVGSILGVANGASQLPAHWTARFNDTLKSGIVDYHPVAISECARRSLDIVRKINAEAHA
jgi:ADP-ribosylglycohydrolase